MKSLFSGSLQRQLGVTIALTLIVGFGITSYYSITQNNKDLVQEEWGKIDLLSTTIMAGIKENMVSGQADVILGWLTKIQKTEDIRRVRVLRKDGTNAFADSKTINEVNTHLDTKAFQPRTKEDPVQEKGGVDAEKLEKAIDSGKPVAFEENLEGSPVITLFSPILKEERCEMCHAYDTHPVRGVLMISLPMDKLIAAKNDSVVRGVFSFVAVILAVNFVLFLLISKRIIKPISEIIFKISSAASQQEQITSQQASSVNEITTTIEELNSSSKQVNGKAESLATQSKESLAVSFEGQKAIENSINEMNVIKNKVEAIAEEVLHLSENTNQVGAIINVVGDIANKTNMLALNASIEAAKAGEQGKGFAVVASEVRSLADQSKKATEKVTTLIQEIQASVNSTVMATEEGARKVDLGVSHILEAGSTINNTIETIRTTTERANEIAIASRQETLANDQVAEAMMDINEGMKESTMATKETIQIVEKIRELVDRRGGQES